MLYGVRYNQGVVNNKSFEHVLRERLQDNYITQWNRAVLNSNDGILYRTYKPKPFYSQLINKLTKPSYRYSFLKCVTKIITIYLLYVVNGFNLNLIMNVYVAHVKF